MKKIIEFTKWRALLAGFVLALITGFLYGKGSATSGVLITLSLASILHIFLFYFLLIKALKKE